MQTQLADRTRWQFTLLGAGYTALYLAGGMLAGFGLGFLVHGGLTGHLREGLRVALAALAALSGVIGGGVFWGRRMGRLAGLERQKRLAWSGGLGFGAAIVMAVGVLSALEVLILESGRGPALEVHVLYTLLFVPAAVIVAAVGSLAICLAANGGGRQAAGVALGAGLAAGAAFLAVNLIMDTLGWRVGAPGAAARATMLTVTMVGALGAALCGGAVVGRWLGAKALE